MEEGPLPCAAALLASWDLNSRGRPLVGCTEGPVRMGWRRRKGKNGKNQAGNSFHVILLLDE